MLFLRLLWFGEASSQRSGMSRKHRFWFGLLSCQQFFFKWFQMLSYAGIFLLVQNQAVLKRHPGTPKNLCQVLRFICNWSWTHRYQNMWKSGETQEGIRDNLCLWPRKRLQHTSKGTLWSFFFLFFVNKLKVFSHSLFLTALVNFLTHELWIKANVCIFNINGAGRRIAFSEQQ